MEIYYVSKTSLWIRVKIAILFRYLVIKDICKTYWTGLKMIVKNEVLWCYDYTHKRLVIVDGLTYIRDITVDLGETAYLKVRRGQKKVTVRVEKF
jgi:hypothetical protein